LTHPQDGAPIDTVQNLRIELLRVTDELLGARAELSISRRTVDDRDQQILTERAEHERDLRELRAAYESSTTWRVGRRIVTPVEIVRRGIAR